MSWPISLSWYGKVWARGDDAMRRRARTQPPDPSLFITLSPLLAGLLGAALAAIGAAARGLPFPADVAAVFLAIGLAATWIARPASSRGALFVLVLAGIV